MVAWRGGKGGLRWIDGAGKICPYAAVIRAFLPLVRGGRIATFNGSQKLQIIGRAGAYCESIAAMPADSHIYGGACRTKSDIVHGQVVAISPRCIIGHPEHHRRYPRRGGKIKCVLIPFRGIGYRYIAGPQTLQNSTICSFNVESNIGKNLSHM